MKRPWTRSEKRLWAAPILLGLAVLALEFGPSMVRRTMHKPQLLAPAPGMFIRSMALSRNGKMVAASGPIDAKGGWVNGSGDIYLWDGRTLAPLTPIPAVYARNKRGQIAGFDTFGLTFSPDAKQIGFSRVEGWELRDVATRELLWHFPHFISDAEFSRDGRLIALSTEEKTFVVRALDGQVVAQWNGEKATWSPDGIIVASIAPDKTIELHRASDGKSVRRIPNKDTQSVAFSPNGRQLIIITSLPRPKLYNASDDFSSFSPVRCYNAKTGALMWKVKSSALGGGDSSYSLLCDAIFAPDGRLVAVYQNWHGQVFLLDSTNGALKTTLQLGGANPMSFYVARGLAFSPDSKRLFARGTDSVRAWDLP